VLSDIDSYGAPPESDSDSEVEVIADHEAALSEDDAMNKDSNDEDFSAFEMDDVFKWLVFGEDPNDMVEEEPVICDASFVGLYWEVGSTINQPPCDEMDEKLASLKQESKHLFNTPIDAMFAVKSSAFWEIMALEIISIASQYMEKYKKNSIFGKKWKPVSVGILHAISSDWSLVVKYMDGPRV
jgi:hypothetical protein